MSEWKEIKEDLEVNIILNKEEIDYLLDKLRLDIKYANYNLKVGNVAKNYEPTIFKEISICEKLKDKIYDAI